MGIPPAPPGSLGLIQAAGWGLMVWGLVAAACALDRLVGDPRSWFHPVQAMGWAIARLRVPAEHWAGDRPVRLRLAGVLIAVAVTLGSALAGWLIETLARWLPAVGVPLLLLALASALAGRSLEQAVREVLAVLPPPRSQAAPLSLGDALASPGDGGTGAGMGRSAEGGLEEARRRLAWIVGRDVECLDESEILRALAETASENAVDGLFAPLFWMLVGAGLWSLTAADAAVAVGVSGAAGPQAVGTPALVSLSPGLLTPWGLGPLQLGPGPLSLAWLFKAASTLDSMLGYRRGRLRWLGTAGARLDDGLTWLPCRLVALSLPWLAPVEAWGGGVAGSGHRPCGSGQTPPWWRIRSRWRRFGQALREGAADPSPNAGVSQAAYALAAGVRMGGVNCYGGELRQKPVLAPHCPPADRAGVERILSFSRRLELSWLIGALPLLGWLSVARG